MEYDNWGAASYVYSGEKWKTRTKSRFEMPVWTVSQRFSHLQWRRLFKELWCRPTTTADFWSPLWQVPYTSNLCLLEDKIQDRGMYYLFTIPYGSNAMDGQGDGVPKACPKQAAADSRGSRTCVCAITWVWGVAHAGGEGWINILPWYRLVGVAKTSSETQRRKSQAARKGKWPPGGTGTTVLTYPRSAPRGTGKAGENGQHSGEVGGSSAWTRPSAHECGDTLKALAGDQRPI